MYGCPGITRGSGLGKSNYIRVRVRVRVRAGVRAGVRARLRVEW